MHARVANFSCLRYGILSPAPLHALCPAPLSPPPLRTQYFEGKPSGLNPASVIRASPYFGELRSAINNTVQEDYGAAREYVKLFEAYRMVYDFGRTWSYEEYSSKSKSLREIRRDMHKQREWRNELDRMKISNVSTCEIQLLGPVRVMGRS